MNPRIPPQSTDAERALLGSIMLKPDGIHEVTDIVSADSFYIEKHRIIFRVMLDLVGSGNPIDLLSTANRLKELGELERAGGNSYLAELVSAVPTSANLKYYGEIVQKKGMMRALIEASSDIGELGYDEGRDIEDLLDSAEKRIYEVTSSPTLRKFVALRDTLGEAWERFDALHKGDHEMRGVPTGFASLDNLLAGFQRSDLIILAARPSMGKTALALDIARQTAIQHGTPVGIFSLEMSSQQLVDRMLAAEAKVDAWKLRTGKIDSDEEFERIRDAMERLSKASIYVDDQPANNALIMRSVARRLKREHGIGLLIVDYLQLMTSPGSRQSDSLVQQVTEISRSLKTLARELDVPVLALSQLSRAIEQRRGRPRLSDLRDSGCLAGNTLITRADTGERVPIKSLVGQTGIPVFSLDSGYQIRPMIATKVFSSGRKRLYTLATRSGRTIRASGNHPFFTLGGWQRLDALQEEDRIALPRALIPHSPTAALRTEELILLAHLLGDGCVLPRQPIHYTSADPENIAVVEQAASTLFGITAKRIRQKNWWHTYLSAPYRLARGRHHPITDWYGRLGILPVRSYEKRIPCAVFSSSVQDIRLFLNHLWATDGNISWKRLSGRKDAAAIYYSTASHGLAEDVQHLLLRLGIWSTIRSVPQGKYRASHQVHVQSAPVQLSFLEQVGSYGMRGRIVPMLIAALQKIAPIPNTDALPKEVWDLFIKPAKEEAGTSWREVAKNLEVSYNGSAVFASGVSRTRLATLARTLSSETLVHLAESGVYWDEVASIMENETEEVYDMEVPGTHNFVAGDILVHNSIEQDADVVMFIHNEDRYKEHDEEKSNVTEILVEKHRNGPTGKIDLFFDAKRATFLPIETSNFGAGGSVAVGAPPDYF